MANQTRQLAALLRSEGVEVTLVQVNPPYRPGWIAGLRGVRALFRLVPYLAALWRAAGKAELVHVMANSGWSWHLFAAPAVLVSRLRGAPVVVNYRGGEAETFFSRSFWSVRPVLRRAAAVIVPSGFLEEVFARRSVPVAIVPNIIDLSRFSSTGAEHAAETEVQNPHLIVCRNLEPIYDVGTAIRAFARVVEKFPGARMTVAGSGAEAGALQQLADDLGVARRIAFTGGLDNQKMVDLYRSASLMLNPSLADNMPISVLEALASGVPVVSTRVGGVPFLVQDGKTALLVEPGDSQGMADAALRLLSDANLRRRLVEHGIEHVRQFTWPQVRERLFAAYGAVLGETRRSPRAGHNA